MYTTAAAQGGRRQARTKLNPTLNPTLNRTPPPTARREGGGGRAGGAGGGASGGGLSPRWLAGGSQGYMHAGLGTLGASPAFVPALVRASDPGEGAEAGGGWRRGSVGTGGGAYIPLAGGAASALSRAAGGRGSEAWEDVEAQVCAS